MFLKISCRVFILGELAQNSSQPAEIIAKLFSRDSYPPLVLVRVRLVAQLKAEMLVIKPRAELEQFSCIVRVP